MVSGGGADGLIPGRAHPELADPPSPKLRVLALLHLPPPVHGLTAQNQRLARGRLAREAELGVIPLRFARGLEDLGRIRPRKALVAGAVLVRQTVELARRRPDVGYLSIAPGGAGLLRDALYMHVFGWWRVPYVVFVPTLGLPASVRRWPAPVRRIILGGLAGAAAVIALNQAHRRELLGLLDGRRVVVVENAVEDVEAAPARPAQGRRILFLSNLREEKGLFTLIEAMPRIAEGMPDILLTMAGQWQDPETERRFHAAVERAGMEDHVEVVGPVDGARKLELFSSARAFVFPSRWDNAPLVILEAMRQALPVVATRVGGIPELVEDGVTGLLVERDDPAALAAAVLALLRDPARAAAIGRAGRAAFERRFTIERWEEDILRVLRDSHARV